MIKIQEITTRVHLLSESRLQKMPLPVIQHSLHYQAGALHGYQVYTATLV